MFQGGAGNARGWRGPVNSVLTGGGGNDSLIGDDGNDFIAGDAGDDAIETGSGSNVVAFNKGGGTDTVSSAADASNTLSFGHGIGYKELSLSKSGNDLNVNAGGDDHVALKDWYAGKDDVNNLQRIRDATDANDPKQYGPLYNQNGGRTD